MDVSQIALDSLKTSLMIIPAFLAVIVPIMFWLMWKMKKLNEALKEEVEAMFKLAKTLPSGNLAEVELQAMQHLMSKLHNWNLSVHILLEVYPRATLRKIGK